MTKFKDVEVGTVFYQNGNKYQKKTSRTALLTWYDRIFYFGQSENVSLKIPYNLRPCDQPIST